MRIMQYQIINYFLEKYHQQEEGQVEIPVTLKDTIDVIDSTFDKSAY